MEYSILAESFEKMESTRKRLELTQFLVELFEKTPQEVISKIVYLIQGKLRPDFEGIRTEFKTYDVAWSFMKQYKKTYPLHNFALVSDVKDSDKPTIFRYI